MCGLSLTRFRKLGKPKLIFHFVIELTELSGGLEATDLVLRYGDKDVVHGAGLRLEPGRIVAW